MARPVDAEGGTTIDQHVLVDSPYVDSGNRMMDG